MAKLLKLRRGTTTQHSSFTGAEGEVTIDTDKDVPVVHDGSTQGGHPVAAEDMSNVSSASIAGRLDNDSIATSKLAAGALPTDVTIASANFTSGQIVNSHINASAAIAGTKIAPDFGSQNISTTGDATITGGELTLSGNFPKFLFVDIEGSDEDAYIVNNSNVLALGKTNNPTQANDILVLKLDDQSAQFKGNLDVDSGIDVTGNMTVTGTVDGVDIATRDTLFGGLTSSSGVLSNGVTATTQAQSDDSTKVSTTAYVRTAISEAQAFPSGTKMLFQQTTAPTGWTKQTSGVDNKALRVVSGTAGSGGSNAFSNTLADRGITANSANATQGGNVSVSVGNTTAGGNISVANAAQGGSVSVSIGNTAAGGTVNSHTLSVSEMPSHNHSGGFNRGSGDDVPQNSPDRKGNNTPTGNTGGSGGHSHGFSGSSHNHNANANFSGSNHNHNATFSGNAHNHNATASFTGSAHNHSISVSNLDLAVAYLDVIIAQKD
tara:strand:- start:1438 stop:2910 length:1473 start_codon:yes stop_codon:yes gene_type:complete